LINTNVSPVDRFLISIDLAPIGMSISMNRMGDLRRMIGAGMIVVKTQLCKLGIDVYSLQTNDEKLCELEKHN
jgi:hypothetical protein